MVTYRTNYFLSCRPRCDVMCHPEYLAIPIPANLPSPTSLISTHPPPPSPTHILTNSSSLSPPSPLDPPSHPIPHPTPRSHAPGPQLAPPLHRISATLLVIPALGLRDRDDLYVGDRADLGAVIDGEGGVAYWGVGGGVWVEG